MAPLYCPDWIMCDGPCSFPTTIDHSKKFHSMIHAGLSWWFNPRALVKRVGKSIASGIFFLSTSRLSSRDSGVQFLFSSPL